MVIVPDDLPKLEAAFADAKRKNVLLYDIMTERFEIATMLQKAFSQQPALFGTLEKGTPEDPAISKISVHNFSKVVAGSQLKRPQWFFDPKQQGAGIVDVMTHLVDLVQWEAFPDVTLSKVRCEGVEGASLDDRAHARAVRPSDRCKGVPRVSCALREGRCPERAGERRDDVHAEGSPRAHVGDVGLRGAAGAGDTHYSLMKGTKASLIIKQGKEQSFKPTLYVERADQASLRAAVADVAKTYPGIDVKAEGNHFVITVPEKYHNGHEAHFGQVTENFLKYVRDGKLPSWEVPNMIVKYATIMQAYEMSR